MPQVEVNERNIDLFNLAEVTGNTREFLLSQAADAASKGMVLSCHVPDELIELNIFDIAPSSEPEPQGVTDQLTANKRCRYEYNPERPDDPPYCIVHHRPSKHNIEADPQASCLAVDPL